MNVARFAAIAAVTAFFLGWVTAACSSPPGPPLDAGSSDARDGAAHDTATTRDGEREAEGGHDVRPRDATGAPVLTQLSVDSAPSLDGSPPLLLIPNFAPDVFDYYLRCVEGTNDVSVTLTASPGAQSEFLRPFVSSEAPTQTQALSLTENEAFVAAATDGKTTTQYWVRCLPHDFPALQMTAHPAAGTPTPGYYLVGDFLPTTQGAYAMVLDSRGVPVWYAKGAGGGMGDVDLVISESISFIPFFAPSPTFQVRGLEPIKTTSVAPSGTLLDGHELQPVADGGFVVISNPVATGFDLTGLTIGLGDGGVASFGPGSSIQDCDLVEFDGATGHVTWSWTGSDHLDPVKDSTFPGFGTFGASGPDGGVVVDPFHCNSVEVDQGTGNLLVSARNMDSVFYVERATGRILWKMGGSPYTKDGAAYVTVADPFYRQHDARFPKGWSVSACGVGTGQVSVFDDESYRPASARGVVYDVVVGAAGSADGGACDAGSVSSAATVSWEYRGTMNSTGIGSFRVTPFGSNVIGWGFGPPGLVFTEVDDMKNDLLDFSFPDGNASYRAIKVPLFTLDLSAMRNAAGLM